MVNISCVHTGASPKIMELLEREFKNAIKCPYTLTHYTAPNIITEVASAGKVTSRAAGDLLKIYTLCMELKTDIVLNVCSSVGGVADVAKPLFEMAGIKIVRIDEEMCRNAVLKQKRIGYGNTPFNT